MIPLLNSLSEEASLKPSYLEELNSRYLGQYHIEKKDLGRDSKSRSKKEAWLGGLATRRRQDSERMTRPDELGALELTTKFILTHLVFASLKEA